MRDLHRTLLIARFEQNGREKLAKKAAKQAAHYRRARFRAEWTVDKKVAGLPSTSVGEKRTNS